MRFFDVLPLVIALLQREQRVTYCALQYAFGFDDTFINVLKKELIFKRMAVDENGEGLVWVGDMRPAVAPMSFPPITEPAAMDDALTVTPDDRRPAALDTPPPQHIPTVATERARTPDAERRQLTVMFCDLVDSTGLSGKLDPEDLREVVRAYQKTATEVIQCYVGIIEAMGQLNGRLEHDKGIRLAIRIGIHTGPVVIGEMGSSGRHEQLALGETPNIAARLEALAGPNSVVVSAITARLVQGVFAIADLGMQALKGVAEPIMVSRILGPLEGQYDEEATASGNTAFLVGRDEEIGLLKRR